MKKKSICLLTIDYGNKEYMYQRYLTRSLLKCMDKLVVLYTGTCSNFWYYKSIGVEFINCKEKYDINRWRNYIVNNYNYIHQFEELYLCNDSMFGPIGNLKKIISNMRNRECDFWGITEHMPIVTESIKTTRFIQRYFMCFKIDSILDAVKEFMVQIDYYQEYSETERFYEFILTDYLHSHGYKSETYCDSKKLDSIEETYFISHILFNPDYLLEQCNLPFVPRYLFEIPKKIYLNYGSGMQIQNTLKFIRKTRYPLENIYEYIIDKVNIYNLITNMNLFYPICECNKKKIIHKKNSCVIIVYLFYEDQFEERISYLKNISCEFDIIIITDCYEKKYKLGKIIDFDCKTLVSNKRGREWAAFLIEAKPYIYKNKYKYLCFLHDKESNYLSYKSIGYSFQNLLWDNLIHSVNYMDKVIELFDKNSRLGVLFPPIANFGIYTELFGNYWTVCYEKTIELAEMINICKDYIDKNYPPISIGSCFWCRVDAIRPLLKYEFSYEDFELEPLPIDGTINHSLERIVPYVAQNEGYLSGYVINEDYEKLLHGNEYYMLREILSSLNMNGTFEQIVKQIDENRR